MKLYYLNSTLELVKDSVGTEKRVEEFKFVTLMAELLLSHGLSVELEPNIVETSKKPDIIAKHSDHKLVFILNVIKQILIVIT